MESLSLKKYLLLIGLTLSSSSFAQTNHDVNPYENATMFVNPDFVKEVGEFFKKNPSYANKANALKLLDGGVWNISTAIWLDSMQAIQGYTPDKGGKTTTSMLGQLYAAAKIASEAKPVTITFVVYDLPGRDCAAYSSNGELPATQEGLTTYENNYIGPLPSSSKIKSETTSKTKVSTDTTPQTIVDTLNTFYNDNSINSQNYVNVVLIIEPDSLPNLITNINNSQTNCPSGSKYYADGIKYTLTQLSNIQNQGHPIFMYLDIAHSGWMGWSSNYGQFNMVYNDKTLGSGFNNVRGFISNTANYTPEQEAFTNTIFNDWNANQGGIRSNPFYQWTVSFDEHTYIGNLISANSVAGTQPQITNPTQMHFLIDTSRNGWIPMTHYAEGQNGIKLTYQRKDQRHHRGNWCNIQSVQPLAVSAYIDKDNNNAPYEPGAPANTNIPSAATSSGLGILPTASPQVINPITNSGNLPLDAYVWIKPPYESDGAYNNPSAPPKKLPGDQMCSNGTGGSHNDGQPTDSLQGPPGYAPLAGQPFDQAFMNLIDVACCIQGSCTSTFCQSTKAEKKLSELKSAKKK